MPRGEGPDSSTGQRRCRGPQAPVPDSAGLSRDRMAPAASATNQRGRSSPAVHATKIPTWVGGVFWRGEADLDEQRTDERLV